MGPRYTPRDKRGGEDGDLHRPWTGGSSPRCSSWRPAPARPASCTPPEGLAWLLARGQRRHALPLAGRHIYLQPFETTQLQRDGKWDKGSLISSLQRRKFPAILIWKPPYARGVYRERWTREMLQTIDQYYTPTHEYTGTVVYRPRPDEDVP